MKGKWRWGVGAGVAMIMVGGIGVAADEAGLRAAFATLDSNGDGLVTQQEFDQNKVEVLYSILQASQSDRSLTFEETRLTREAFDAADTDGDGQLSGAEWVLAPFAQFTTYDADSDGAITEDDFVAVSAQFLR